MTASPDDLDPAEFCVGPDGGVICYPGLRIDIPPGVLRQYVDERVRAGRHVPPLLSALSPSYSMSTRVLEQRIELNGPITVSVYRRPELAGPAELAATVTTLEDSRSRRVPALPSAFREFDDRWEIEFDEWLPTEVAILGPNPFPDCNNGVLDPGEVCDPALSRDTVSSGYACGNRFFCDELTPGYDCDSSGCWFICDRLNCEDVDFGPCMEPQCYHVYGQCYGVPTNESEPCTSDDGVVGWCNAGTCDPTPRDCLSCEDRPGVTGEQGILWGGECRDAEYSDWRVNTSSLETVVLDAIDRDGVWDEYWIYDFLDIYANWDASSATLLTLRYEFLDWFELEDGQLVANSTYAIDNVEEAGPDGVYMLPLGEPGEIMEIQLTLGPDPWPSGSRVSVEVVESEIYEWSDVPGIGLVFDNIHQSSLGILPCGTGVYVDDDVQVCWDEPHYERCGDYCVRVSDNERNCGGCGIRCGADEHCIGGECQCHPALAALNPDACRDGCPAGWGGPQCDRECPGQIGEGIYCNGRGTCNDGPYGDGTCGCPYFVHGDACQFSCSDGLRNGNERGFDCGDGVCTPCDLLLR